MKDKEIKKVEGEKIENIEKTEGEVVRVERFVREESLEDVVKKAEAEVESFKKIKNIALRLTNENDWIDEGGEPYLEMSGCAKIRSFFGISIVDMRNEMKLMEDAKGKYYLVVVYGKGIWRGRIEEDVGIASTRDRFFGKNKGLEDVDIGNVIKKAVTNLQNRLIKKLLGLFFEWKDLEEAGLDVKKIKKVEYKKGDMEKVEKEIKELRDKIINEVCKMRKTAGERRELVRSLGIVDLWKCEDYELLKSAIQKLEEMKKGDEKNLI